MTIVGNWGVDKTKTVPGDLSYLSNIVLSTILLPKSVCDKLVVKVNAIYTKTPSTSWLVLFEQTM